jgi:dynein heavy chain, axonemal
MLDLHRYLRFFNRKVQENMHIMLVLSSIGTQLRKKIRDFPSIVNCCTICYFEQWPESALEKVAQK